GTPPQRHELISARIAVREPGDRFLEEHGRDPSLHRPDSLKPPPVRGQRRSLQTSRLPLDVAKPGRPVAPDANPSRGPCSGQLPPRRERLDSRQASYAPLLILSRVALYGSRNFATVPSSESTRPNALIASVPRPGSRRGVEHERAAWASQTWCA